jgi:hypothetical protein
MKRFIDITGRYKFVTALGFDEFLTAMGKANTIYNWDN